MGDSKSNTFVIVRLVAAGLLLIALADLSYGYYTFLRIVVCAVCAYSAYIAFSKKIVGWAWAMTVIAVLFNPLVPIHLSRVTWAPVDVATAAILIVSVRGLASTPTSTPSS